MLVPICNLLPSCAGYSVDEEGTQEISYKPDGWEEILSPSEAARSAIVDILKVNSRMVTITLRQSDFQVARNSNIEELKKLADWLKARGFSPVFVPDTEAYLSGKHVDTGHKEAIAACLNVDLRLALYEQATLNIFTSGGPFALALYGGASMLLCKNVVPEVSSCTQEVQDRLGFHAGAKLANEYQKVAGCGDSFDELKPVVQDFLEKCQGREKTIRRIAVFSVLGERRIENMREAMKRGLPELVQGFDQKRPMAVVCYGPSLKKTWRRLLSAEEDIYTVSGAHDFLLEKGIVPKGHIESDPRKHKAAFTRNAVDGVTYYIASCCDAEVFDQLAGKDVRLWHCWDSPKFELEMAKIDPNAMLIGGGSNVGLRAISVGTVMGYKQFSVYGMDCSFDGEEQHAGAHSGKRQRIMSVRCGDRYFQSSPQMVTSCNEFFELLVNLNGTGCEFLVHGDGLLQHRLRLENANLAAIRQPLGEDHERLACVG